MTYPPPGGQQPDPYQPQEPYGRNDEPTTPDPYGAPGSGAPGYGQQPGAYGSPGGYPPPGQYPQQYPSSGQPQYGQPQYGQAQYGQPYEAPPRTNGLAIASLVCSIAGLATCISAPVGIVLGHLAKRQIRQTGESGSGLATAGLVIGYILTIGFIITVIGIILAAANSGGTSSGY